MSPKFGTSGLRGLVLELTNSCIKNYTKSFINSLSESKLLFIGWDLRPSSPDIVKMIQSAAEDMGVEEIVICGDVPTPAVALSANIENASAIMVTGSHIPADRNGLKFYTPRGEITKQDEQAILSALGAQVPASTRVSTVRHLAVGASYIERYTNAFGANSLKGLCVGVYTHSSVGRDLLMTVLKGCGANVIELERSETFIPVDTEAVDPATRKKLQYWSATHKLDAIVSLDGDADRPMLADENGHIVPGDVLGQITAQVLGATTVVTPISSNTGLSDIAAFSTVETTRIGSPFVIAGMERAIASGDKSVVGYEANGGFLLGFEATLPGGHLTPLMTRDAFLPILAVLTASREIGVSKRVEQEPNRFTAADRIQNLDSEQMSAYVESLRRSANDRAGILNHLGKLEKSCDFTDGIRMICDDQTIVHIRPSGNAPEMRLYVESSTVENARELLAQGMDFLSKEFAVT